MKASHDTLIDLRDATVVHARRPLLIAHRGGVIAPNAPENSLAAIRLAAECGYDLVELDVTRSSDGQPVLFHDYHDNLLTNCGLDLQVTALTAAELTTIRYRATTETIATLAQALALCQQLHLGVMLDIKERGAQPPTEDFVARIATLLHDYSMTSSALSATSNVVAREGLGDYVLLSVLRDDALAIQHGRALDATGQFWFELPEHVPDTAIPRLHASGALVLPAINTFRYLTHAHHALAQADTTRLLRAGVDGVQIDSTYRAFFH